MKHWIAVGIFIVSFIFFTVVSPNIGVTWDEPDNIWAAGVYIRFFQSGLQPSVLVDRNASASYFADKIFTQEPSLYRYPPFPLYIGNIVVFVGEKIFGSLTSQQIIYAFHIASGFFLALLAVAIFYFAQLFGFSLFVSCITVLITIFHPTLFGYGISIIKDSAQVSLFTLSLLLFVVSTQKKNKKLLLFGTLVWGSAMATKINALYVPIIWTGWKGILSIQQLVHSMKTHPGTLVHLLMKWGKQVWQELVLPLIVIVPFGLIVMVVLWPYLWFDPLVRMQEVVRYFTTVGTGYKVFWNGNIYMVGAGTALPWYPLIHILVGTPIPVLLFSLLGFGMLILQVFRGKTSAFKWGVLFVIWIGIPLLRTFRGDAAFYDGMRHFLEVLPPLLLLSAWGLQGTAKAVSKRFGTEQQVNAILAFGLITYLVMITWFFFPYTSGYVNALAKEPNKTLERDFAGLSIAEAVRVGHKIHPGPSTIFVPIGGHLSWYFLTQGDQYVYSVADSDIVVLINKPSHLSKTVFDAQVSSLMDLKGSIVRGNNVFAWIYVKR